MRCHRHDDSVNLEWILMFSHHYLWFHSFSVSVSFYFLYRQSHRVGCFGKLKFYRTTCLYALLTILYHQYFDATCTSQTSRYYKITTACIVSWLAIPECSGVLLPEGNAIWLPGCYSALPTAFADRRILPWNHGLLQKEGGITVMQICVASFH